MGKVKEVPLRGELQGGVMVYSVPIGLEGIVGQPLLVGMTANVVIEVGEVKGALLVPALALQRVSGAYQVLVQGEGGETVGAPATRRSAPSACRSNRRRRWTLPKHRCAPSCAPCMG